MVTQKEVFDRVICLHSIPYAVLPGPCLSVMNSYIAGYTIFFPFCNISDLCSIEYSTVDLKGSSGGSY